jgi:hypothetical protein
MTYIFIGICFLIAVVLIYETLAFVARLVGVV